MLQEDKRKWVRIKLLILSGNYFFYHQEKETMNNFNLISELINFEDKNDFYFIQIFKRRKDNPEMKRDVTLIDNFFIYSKDEFEKVKEKIINLCDSNNARAYIRLNRRNAKKIAHKTMIIMAESIDSENYRLENAYLSACGKFNSEKNKKWIIDLDYPEILDKIIEYLKTITEVISIIPTKNGYHIVVKPFNPNLLKNCSNEKIKNSEIKDDSPTVLYCK